MNQETDAGHAADFCCEKMYFACKCALIRRINGPYFGPDVFPAPLTEKIIACPWCGKPTPQGTLTREEDLPTVEDVQAIYRQAAESRVAFEKWISAPPIERSVRRCPNEPDKYAFAGQYDDYPVQLAWESWQESRNQLTNRKAE